MSCVDGGLRTIFFEQNGDIPDVTDIFKVNEYNLIFVKSIAHYDKYVLDKLSPELPDLKLSFYITKNKRIMSAGLSSDIEDKILYQCLLDF